MCVLQNSRSCLSRLPLCCQWQQQAASLLAANRPNLDPQGQHSVHECVCIYGIYPSICDWLVVTVTYVVGPLLQCHPVRVFLSAYRQTCAWVNIWLFGSGLCICVLTHQLGFYTPVSPHWEILTLLLLGSLHPNKPPSDCPYVTPLAVFVCSFFFSCFSPIMLCNWIVCLSAHVSYYYLLDYWHSFL